MSSEASSVARHHAELTDAIARGRLALAEIAAIPPRELDALYELGAGCLDTGRHHDAVDLLGGLVALFPFAAAYWRAYAIALHRCLELEAARAAYDAALLLQPGHARTRCYRAEILLYLGRKQEARGELVQLVLCDEAAIAERAAELVRLIDALADWRPEPLPPPLAVEDAEPFELDDARPLPLEESRFSPPDDGYLPAPREITNTARIFAPIAEPTAAGLAADEFTDTALLPGQQRRAAARIEDTGLAEGTDTALLVGRQAAARTTKTDPSADLSAPAEGNPEPEVTHTAIFLRRAGVPLVEQTGVRRAEPELNEAHPLSAPLEDSDG